MDEPKWVHFIQHLWGTLAYWELCQLYLKEKPEGYFFRLTYRASRDHLTMRIAHSVAVCREIAKAYDVGDEAKKLLAEIEVLFERNDPGRRQVAKLDDCGVKPFRDKVVSHPVSLIQAVLGKDELEVSMEWATVEATLNKIKKFADSVEQYHLGTGRFQSSYYKGDTHDVELAFRGVMRAMDQAAEYHQLKLEVMERVVATGKATVCMDSSWDKVIIADQG